MWKIIFRHRIMTKRNTAVHVTGLPSKITVEELASVFSRCGIILPDLSSAPSSGDGEKHRPRIKIYKATEEEEASARIIFLKPESVQLAVMLFDDSDVFSTGHTIHVEPAINPPLTEKDAEEEDVEAASTYKDRMLIDKATWRRRFEAVHSRTEWQHDEDVQEQRTLQRQLAWQCILVIQNVVPPFDAEALEDVRQECLRLIIPLLYDDYRSQVDHDQEGAEDVEANLTALLRKTDRLVKVSWLSDPPGWLTIKFPTRHMASHAQTVLDRRWYNQRQLQAFVYTGQPKLVLWHPQAMPCEEGEEEREEQVRLEAFSQWIEQQPDQEEDGDQ
jgi:HIV Tat-specific factor 1